MCVCVADTHSHHSSCFHSRVWPQRHSAGHGRWDRGVPHVWDPPHLLTWAAPVEGTVASPSCRWRTPHYGQTIAYTRHIHICFYVFRGCFKPEWFKKCKFDRRLVFLKFWLVSTDEQQTGCWNWTCDISYVFHVKITVPVTIQLFRP